MRSVEEIMKPVKSELNEFESHFEDALKSNVPLLDKVTHYIVKRKGKQMRPLFVFLSAKMLGKINEKTYKKVYTETENNEITQSFAFSLDKPELYAEPSINSSARVSASFKDDYESPEVKIVFKFDGPNGFKFID